MITQPIDMLASLAALAAGGMIGVGFGMIQAAARRRNEKRQAAGQLTSGWAVMPGSGGRVALLVITLVLVQIVCPMLFADGIQWWVSCGVVAGYGAMLFRQLFVDARRV